LRAGPPRFRSFSQYTCISSVHLHSRAFNHRERPLARELAGRPVAVELIARSEPYVFACRQE
jgi:hypothetical protein